MRNSVLKVIQTYIEKRNFCLNSWNGAGKMWRLRQGLPACGNEYGALVDIPDWSYADGRPSPIQIGERKRRGKRKVFTSTAMALMEEMKSTKTIHQKRLYDEKEAKERKIKQKLKPKSQVK